MPFDIDDDEYVANLLAQDAKNISKKYDLVGLNAFNPKRLRNNAPKPNTNFLRHIIRQTDNHNAALLAKEAEESSSRLRQMNRESHRDRTEAVDRVKRRIERRLSPSCDSDNSKQHRSRRRTDDDDGRNRKEVHRRSRRDDCSESHSKKHRSKNLERYKHRRGHEDDEQDRKSSRSREHCKSGRGSRHDRGEEEDDEPRQQCRGRRQSRSRSISQSRSRSPCRKSRRAPRRSRSPRRSSCSPTRSRRNTRRSNTPASDSDPLEAIVGPLPPPPKPTVRSRGRGAIKASSSSGIESRFSANYDPSMDLRPDSDHEDDWAEAVEAMRDRERWKQQGADRLRAAGFKDEQVKKWERGGDPMETDVVWTKKGQGREWDRGKVVDEDGDVAVKAEWGRLK